MSEEIKQFIQQKLEDEVKINNFLAWFENSKVVDEFSGEPLQVYHGTTHSIESFDDSFSYNEAYVGKGFYFSTSSDDASSNYASTEGPDLVNKMGDYSTQLIDLDIDEYANILNKPIEELEPLSEDEISELIDEHVASKFIGDNLGNVLPVYLSIKNPLVIDSQNPTILDWNPTYDGNGETLLESIVESFEKFDGLDGMDEVFIYDIKEDLKDDILSANITTLEEFLEGFNDHNLIEELKDEYPDTHSLLYAEVEKNALKILNMDDEIEITEKFEGSLYNFFEHFKNYIYSKNSDHNIEERLEKALDSFKESLDFFSPFEDFSIDISTLKSKMENHEDFVIDLDSDNGDPLYIGDFINYYAKKENHDGIALRATDTHFKNMKHIYNDVVHYIAFSPNQIKSSIGNNGNYSLEHDEICFRLKNKDISLGISQRDAKEHMEHFKNAFKQFPKVTLIKQERDIPNKVKKHLKDRNIDSNNLKGYFYRSNVYVFLKNIEDKEDLNKTLLHESFHVGFRNMMGPKANKLLNSAYYYFYNNKQLYDIKKEHNLDFRKSKDRLAAAEEKIAEIAENGKEIPFYNRFMGLIRNAARKVNIKLEVDKNDIDYIIHSSFKHFNKGGDFKYQNQSSKIEKIKENVIGKRKLT